MASAALDIAIVGVDTLLAEQLLEVLEDSELPLGNVLGLVAEVGGDGEGTPLFRGRRLRLAALDGFDFSRVQLVFLLQAADPAAALAAGCRVIDLGPAAGARPGAQLAVAELCAPAPAWPADAVLACPGAAALAAALVLAPLADAGLTSVHAVIMEPASALGRAGVEALAGETARLLNGLTPQQSVFPGQMAFNLLPQLGGLDADGHSGAEQDFCRELGVLLQAPAGGRQESVAATGAVAVSATVVSAPVFHGTSLALHVRTREPLSADAVRKRLRRQAGIKLLDQPERAVWPAPVSERLDRDRVCVGRVRNTTEGDTGLALWVVVDNLRKGAAVNSVQLASILMNTAF